MPAKRIAGMARSGELRTLCMVIRPRTLCVRCAVTRSVSGCVPPRSIQAQILAGGPQLQIGPIQRIAQGFGEYVVRIGPQRCGQFMRRDLPQGTGLC
ncbi:hypothetical protein SAMN05216190_10691 [Pseudomonas borbori]|uniref:Uncharacterized protein n=1 Tax=Pseudomonas borbori TaxID=289003 RepID=A0A1I5NCG5_9PSED|nr:hypothetical protein SAMN05216190_10691 [Pseudomonas borbori]